MIGDEQLAIELQGALQKREMQIRQIKNETIEQIESRMDLILFSCGLNITLFNELRAIYYQRIYDKGCEDGYETAVGELEQGRSMCC